MAIIIIDLHSDIITLLQSPRLIETNSTKFSLFNLTLKEFTNYQMELSDF